MTHGTYSQNICTGWGFWMPLATLTKAQLAEIDTQGYQTGPLLSLSPRE